MSNSLLSGLASGTPFLSVDPIERLTNGELQVLQLIGKGSSTREAAQRLHLSIKTVESHRQRIKRKLNLTTSVQLMRYAVLSHAPPPANSPAVNDQPLPPVS
jgi:DNA-binding CsgD family transcriptional regulator